MNKLILSALALVTLASCSKENNNTVINPNTPVAAQFSSAPLTRVASNSWEANDQIGIYMVAKDATLTDANTEALGNGTNIIHTVTAAGATGTFTPDAAETIYFPVDGSAVDFYAYYPHQTGIVDGLYKVDVSTQTSFSAIDLLASKVVNKTKANPAIALAFTHQLSKITLNISEGVGITTAELAGLTVTFEGLFTTSDFNLADNSFATGATPQNITAATNTAGTISQAILIPSGAVAAATVCFMLNNVENEKFYWNISDKAFVGGKNISYDITMNRSGIVVSGSTIVNWAAEDGGSGNAN